MEEELKDLLNKIINKLDSIESNTSENYYVKSAVEDVEIAVKELKEAIVKR